MKQFILNKYTYKLIILSAFLFTYSFSSDTIFAQEERFIIEAGAMYQDLPLDQSYGKFLKRRFGIKHLVLNGNSFSVQYLPDVNKKFSIGLESNSLSGSFGYSDLNGTKKTNSFSLSQTIFMAKYLIHEHILVAGGVGSNVMTREVYGYKNESIVGSNIKDQEGKKTDESQGDLLMLEAIFKLNNNFTKKPPFSADLGIRYLRSEHTIASGDSRPAVSEKGVPIASIFNVGGFALFINLSLAF